MPLLPKCANCDREGGYAEKDSDTICLRCKKLLKRKKEVKNDENLKQE